MYSKVKIVTDLDFLKSLRALLHIHFGEKLDISNSFLISRSVSDILSEQECARRGERCSGGLYPRFREQGQENPRT